MADAFAKGWAAMPGHKRIWEYLNVVALLEEAAAAELETDLITKLKLVHGGKSANAA